MFDQHRLVFFLSVCFLGAMTPIDRIVITVNNEPILQSDFKLLRQKIQNNEILNDLVMGDWQPQELLKDENKMRKYLIREKILDSEVKRLNLTVTSDRVEQELREIARRNGVRREQLPQVLESQGIKFSSYQNYLKTRIEHQSLVDTEIASKLKINDEDLQSAYYLHFKKKPKMSFEVELHHIFFKPAKRGRTDINQKAEIVLQQLTNGGDFFELADRYSEDPHFQKKGYLGKFQKEDLDPKLAEAIESYKKGLIPKVFVLKSGVHIFWIQNLRIIEDPHFVAQKEALRARLFEQQLKEALERWFVQKENQMEVVVLPNESSS